MKPFRLLLATLLIFFSACEKEQVETPDCTNALIKTYSFCKKGGSVSQYSFQNKIVYVFDPGLCGADMAAGVYNESCVNIGILGGIAGINVVNGEIFYGHAKFIKTIWTN
jgi:hypothetical protein